MMTIYIILWCVTGFLTSSVLLYWGSTKEKKQYTIRNLLFSITLGSASGLLPVLIIVCILLAIGIVTISNYFYNLKEKSKKIMSKKIF